MSKHKANKLVKTLSFIFWVCFIHNFSKIFGFIFTDHFYECVSSFLSCCSCVWTLGRREDLRQEVADSQEGISILLDPSKIFVDVLEDLLVVRVIEEVYPEAGVLVATIFHKDIQDCSQKF